MCMLLIVIVGCAYNYNLKYMNIRIFKHTVWVRIMSDLQKQLQDKYDEWFFKNDKPPTAFQLSSQINGVNVLVARKFLKNIKSPTITRSSSTENRKSSFNTQSTSKQTRA